MKRDLKQEGKGTLRKKSCPQSIDHSFSDSDTSEDSTDMASDKESDKESDESSITYNPVPVSVVARVPVPVSESPEELSHKK